MGRIARRNVLTGSGNQAVFPADTALYSCPTHHGATSTLAVQVGQFVFYDPDTMVSLGPGISTTTNSVIGIGVGVQGPKGRELRGVVGDRISGCHTEAVSDFEPVCGYVPQKDLWVECTECFKDYSIVVRMMDNESEGFTAHNRGNEYMFSYRTDCTGCGDDCPQPHNANELICGLHNVINGVYQPGWDIKLNGKPIGVQELPFSAHKLFFGDTVDGDGVPTDVTHYEFCFVPTAAGTCTDCNAVTAISEITIGDDDPVALTFTPHPDDSELMTTEQLYDVANEISALLGGRGQATVVESVGGPCCALTLVIDSCDTIVIMDNQDPAVEIDPCAEGNPFAAGVGSVDNCQDCDSVDTTSYPNVGLRFFGKATSTPCECFAGNSTKAWLGSTLDVYPITGFEEGGYHVIEVQLGTLPQGMGYVWEERELRYMRQGGSGYKYTIRNEQGKYNLPADDSKIGKSTVDCREQYCIIALSHTKPQRQGPMGGGVISPRWESYFLIPSTDTTTQTEFLQIFNDYFAGGACGLTSVSCGQEVQ